MFISFGDRTGMLPVEEEVRCDRRFAVDYRAFPHVNKRQEESRHPISVKHNGELLIQPEPVNRVITN